MADTILDSIKAGLKDLKQLEVVTVVGSIDVNIDAAGKITVNIPANATPKPKAMVSRIDLVDGDIRNLIDPAFVTGDLASLRDFHDGQVKKGNDIILKNIETVVALAKELGEIVSR